MNCERNKFSAKKKVKNKNKNESLDACKVPSNMMKLHQVHNFLKKSFSQLVNVTNYDRYMKVFLQPILQLENVTNYDRYEKYVYTPIDII